MKEKRKIIFIGTPEFGAVILEELAKSIFKPALVITAPDKPVGRKQILTPSPVKVLAQKQKIPLLQPEKIKSHNSHKAIKAIEPDLIVVAAYGQILPKEILNIPKYGCLNVHPSLLPKYQGPSPIQYAILNGDKKTGVTIILIDEKIDQGPILAQKALIIKKDETIENLHNKLANLGADLLIKTIPRWTRKTIKPKLQDKTKASYTKILKKEDGEINWQKSAEEIERQIRAFNPWPSAYSGLKVEDKELKILKIWKAGVLKQTKAGPFGQPGKVFLASNNKIAIQTGKDYLIVEELQPEGKKKMTAEEFLRGRLDFIGKLLK